MFGNIQTKSVLRKIPAKPQIKVSPATTSTPPPKQSASPAVRSKEREKSGTPQPRKSGQGKSHNGQLKAKEQPLVRKAVKRKASTPPPIFDSSSSDSDSDGRDSEISFDSARKRIRSSASSVDPGRNLLDRTAPWKGAPEDFPLAHAADLVTDEKEAHKYRPAFVEEIATGVALQYPSATTRERFWLANSVEKDGYQSMDDIRETVKYVCSNYLPSEEAERCTDDGSGFERRLIRAFKNDSTADYVKVIEEYNTLIEQRLKGGTISKVLMGKHGLSSDWMKRILDQVYSRTVSPNVDSLKEYKNGTDNVYGELLYPLVTEMFRETQIQSHHVFVDLGSGVGNVVLQAALEIGCESWGCEMMKNPCDLADLQAEEFPQRAKLWGLSVGQVRLLRGDFLENNEIGEVLRRADVVLVNNQAFGPDLNSKLINRFLDLKDGCQIVSLKSFKPEGFEIQERNMNDVRHLLKVRKLEYFSNRVSWTDAPGNYYIAKKDPSDLNRFVERMKQRRR